MVESTPPFWGKNHEVNSVTHGHDCAGHGHTHDIESSEELEVLKRLYRLEKREFLAGLLGGVFSIPQLLDTLVHKPFDLFRIRTSIRLAEIKLYESDDRYPNGYHRRSELTHLLLVVASFSVLVGLPFVLPTSIALITSGVTSSLVVMLSASYQVWTDYKGGKIAKSASVDSPLLLSYLAHKPKDMSNSAFVAFLGAAGLVVSVFAVPAVLVTAAIGVALGVSLAAGLRGVRLGWRVLTSTVDSLTDRMPSQISEYMVERTATKVNEELANQNLSVRVSKLRFVRSGVSSVNVSAVLVADNKLVGSRHPDQSDLENIERLVASWAGFICSTDVGLLATRKLGFSFDASVDVSALMSSGNLTLPAPTVGPEIGLVDSAEPVDPELNVRKANGFVEFAKLFGRPPEPIRFTGPIRPPQDPRKVYGPIKPPVELPLAIAIAPPVDPRPARKAATVG